MPPPVLPYASDHPIMNPRPVIAGGFIRSATDAELTLTPGAVAPNVSSPELWGLTPEKTIDSPLRKKMVTIIARYFATIETAG